MDVTIEMWSVDDQHFAKCSGDCIWLATSDDMPLLVSMVKEHRKDHERKGDFVEIV